MVTEDELFRRCPPRRPLDSAISQYTPEIRDLELYRRGVIPQPRTPRDADDLRSFVKESVTRDEVASFSPFELLTKIHSSQAITTEIVREEIGSTKQGKLVRTYAPIEIAKVREVSAPVHFRDGGSIVVVSEQFESGAEPINPAIVQQSYLRSLRDVQERESAALKKQYATYVDLITINRRLIDLDIRCIRCKGGDEILCFPFDWVRRELK